MVWYFIDVYIINRTLHGPLEIRNFSSHVEKIFHSFAALTREIFCTQREICISAQPCNILYLLLTLINKLLRHQSMDDGAKKISTAYCYPQSYFFAHCQAMNQSHFRSYLLHCRSIILAHNLQVIVAQLQLIFCFSSTASGTLL